MPCNSSANIISICQRRGSWRHPGSSILMQFPSSDHAHCCAACGGQTQTSAFPLSRYLGKPATVQTMLKKEVFNGDTHAGVHVALGVLQGAQRHLHLVQQRQRWHRLRLRRRGRCRAAVLAVLAARVQSVQRLGRLVDDRVLCRRLIWRQCILRLLRLSILPGCCQ